MKFKVGDKVQVQNRDGVRDCEVVELFPKLHVASNEVYAKWQSMSEEERKPYQERIRVRFTDGLEDEFEYFHVYRRDSELERTFRLESNKVMDQIGTHLAAAMAALSEAEDLSEKHGIPFSSGISPLGQSYFPKSFDDMWGNKLRELEDEFEDEDVREIISNITGANQGEYQDSGWEHSAVCY